MRISQLEYFVRVCETGSITSAAEQLNVAQPALGMQIKSLENTLGVRLLDRTRRGTLPTPAGRLFLEDARHILASLQVARRRLREHEAGAPQTINLGLTPSLTTLLTGPLLEAAKAQAPHLRLQIFEDFSHSLVDRLETGQLDCALVYSVPETSRLHRLAKLRERLVFVCQPGSPLDGDTPLAFQQLTGVPFVMPSKRDFVRQVFEAELERHGLSVNILYQVESMPAMKDLISRGLAYGILPRGTVAREVTEGTLRVRQVIDPPLRRTLYLAHASGDPSDRARAAIVAVVEGLLAELPARYESFEPV